MRNTILRDLPLTPEEVVDTWLLPLTDRNGWPPTKTNDWRFILGRDNDLSYLQGLRWTKESLHLSPTAFTTKHLRILVDLCRSYVFGETTIYSHYMKDGRTRFDRAKAYLSQQGVFPVAPALERTAAGLAVLDGNHRLAAYLYLYGYINVQNDEVPCLTVQEQQEVWVAAHA